MSYPGTVGGREWKVYDVGGHRSLVSIFLFDNFMAKETSIARFVNFELMIQI